MSRHRPRKAAMTAMSPTLHWPDVLLRLAMTLAAGAVIGANRLEHGKAAGLRTTILVCLAASVAMLLTNLLLGTGGKRPDSFAQFDVMRLPLGILTGVGFIGGGTILHRRDLVTGVTTAATLWLVTVIGLCIGGGEIGLGLAATGLGFAILSGVALAERRMPQDRRAQLVVAYGRASPIEALSARLHSSGFAVTDLAVSFLNNGEAGEARFDLRWRTLPAQAGPPEFLAEFASRPDIRAVHWRLVAAR
jgi:putative Mg2+ transporter-C (MgtC) family protein